MPYVSNTVPEIGRPGVLEWIYLGMEDVPDQVAPIVGSVMDTNKTYEDLRTLSDFNYATVLDEGENIAVQSLYSPFNLQVYPIMRALGFEITKQARYTDLYNKVKNPVQKLGVTMKETRNLVASTLLSLGFTDPQSSGTITMDDEALFDTDHPIANSTSTAANRPSIDLPLNAANIQTARKDLRMQVTESGKPMVNAGACKLIVPPSLEWTAKTILRSALLPGSANNDENVVRDSMSLFVADYITSTDLQNAWWLVMEGRKNPLCMLKRMPLEVEEDYDKRSLTHFYGVHEEYEVFAKDWRGTWATNP